jgi:hypothetical protein
VEAPAVGDAGKLADVTASPVAAPPVADAGQVAGSTKAPVAAPVVEAGDVRGEAAAPATVPVLQLITEVAAVKKAVDPGPPAPVSPAAMELPGKVEALPLAKAGTRDGDAGSAAPGKSEAQNGKPGYAQGDGSAAKTEGAVPDAVPPLPPASKDVGPMHIVVPELGGPVRGKPADAGKADAKSSSVADAMPHPGKGLEAALLDLGSLPADVPPGNAHADAFELPQHAPQHPHGDWFS